MTDRSFALEQVEPVDRTSVLGSVIERLEGVIFESMEPGDALPSEGKLAEALGVSRLTVREATRSLEARGLLEISKGRRRTGGPRRGHTRLRSSVSTTTKSQLRDPTLTTSGSTEVIFT